MFFDNQYSADLYNLRANNEVVALRDQANKERDAELRSNSNDWVDPITGKARTPEERDQIRDQRAREQQAAYDAKQRNAQQADPSPRRKTMPAPVSLRRGQLLENADHARNHGVRVVRAAVEDAAAAEAARNLNAVGVA